MWGSFLYFEQFGYSCYGSSEVTRVSEVTPDDGMSSFCSFNNASAEIFQGS